MRDSAAACDYSAAADEGVPFQGIGLARVYSPHAHVHVATIRRCVQVLSVLIARGPHHAGGRGVPGTISSLPRSHHVSVCRLAITTYRSSQ